MGNCKSSKFGIKFRKRNKVYPINDNPPEVKQLQPAKEVKIEKKVKKNVLDLSSNEEINSIRARIQEIRKKEVTELSKPSPSQQDADFTPPAVSLNDTLEYLERNFFRLLIEHSELTHLPPACLKELRNEKMKTTKNGFSYLPDSCRRIDVNEEAFSKIQMIAQWRFRTGNLLMEMNYPYFEILEKLKRGIKEYENATRGTIFSPPIETVLKSIENVYKILNQDIQSNFWRRKRLRMQKKDYISRAIAHRDCEEVEDGVRVLEEYREIFQNTEKVDEYDVRAWRILGQCYYMLDNYEQTRVIFEEYCKLFTTRYKTKTALDEARENSLGVYSYLEEREKKMAMEEEMKRMKEMMEEKLKAKMKLKLSGRMKEKETERPEKEKVDENEDEDPLKKIESLPPVVSPKKMKLPPVKTSPKKMIVENKEEVAEENNDAKKEVVKKEVKPPKPKKEDLSRKYAGIGLFDKLVGMGKKGKKKAAPKKKEKKIEEQPKPTSFSGSLKILGGGVQNKKPGDPQVTVSVEKVAKVEEGKEEEDEAELSESSSEENLGAKTMKLDFPKKKLSARLKPLKSASTSPVKGRGSAGSDHPFFHEENFFM